MKRKNIKIFSILLAMFAVLMFAAPSNARDGRDGYRRHDGHHRYDHGRYDRGYRYYHGGYRYSRPYYRPYYYGSYYYRPYYSYWGPYVSYSYPAPYYYPYYYSPGVSFYFGF